MPSRKTIALRPHAKAKVKSAAGRPAPAKGRLRRQSPSAINIQRSERDKLAGKWFEKLVALQARLRAPNGCPWDREQTHESLRKFLIEETYEVLDAMEAGDAREFSGELGDLLLQAVFFAQMASEEGHFDIRDSLEAINSKLVRRHPHVFGDGDAKTSDEVLRKWDEIKKTEKPHPQGLLTGVPRTLPALVEAQQIASRAATAGFDWENVDQVFDKLKEELDELHAASSQDQREDELGDMLFVIVNIARFLKVDPEQALRRTNAKFRARFSHVEQGLGKPLKDATVAEMEALWQAAKKL